MNAWHTLNVQETTTRLETELRAGLSAPKATELLAIHGHNELVDKGSKSILKIIWEQLTAIMVLILIVAAVASFFLGEITDGAFILVIVALNAVLGVTQEFKAEKAMEALKRLAVPIVRVRRDGAVSEISARDLVPGDVVLLEAGNTVPADCRIVESANLKIQESALTGESEAVEKSIAVVERADTPLGDRRNMAYMGTHVTYGRGVVLVAETGMRTELGRIASMIQGVGDTQTPLQKRLAQLGKGLLVAALAVVAVVFVLGLLRDGLGVDNIRLMAMTAVSMAVAAVPEGLPAIVTIALALGAQRMLKKRALIRKLMAVETLGSVTVICSDKTGTLTENRMTVTLVDVAGATVEVNEALGHEAAESVSTVVDRSPHSDSIVLLLAAGALCNDAVLARQEEGGHIKALGDPTEAAMVVAAARFGLGKDALEAEFPRTGELPFDSERKRMSTRHPVVAGTRLGSILAKTGTGDTALFVKGSVDGLLDIAAGVFVSDRVETMTPELRARIQDANARMASGGMRVLGVACRRLDGYAAPSAADETELVFVGMVGMIDPPRAEVRAAVAECRSAGIRPVMITGDHPLTALAIAKDLGIATNDRVLTGADLTRMTEDELGAVVDEVNVYARVSPENKIAIVTALQKRGHIAAMTGDGVNDAPALKKADIGVAMGITGTDVSKEAANMVLQDDNFATIVAAVEEGRIIYDNIRKFIRYLLTSNAGEIWVMLLAPFIGMPLPLMPLQILWINLVTDGLPALALSVEPAEANVMKRRPVSPKQNIFGGGMGIHILWVGLFMGLLALGTGFVYRVLGRAEWQTMTFCVITFSQMAHVLAIRTGNISLFKAGLLSNKALLGSVLLTVALQFAVIYLPAMQNVFRTMPLSALDLLISVGLSAVVFFVVEVEKVFLRRKERKTV